MKLMMLAGAGLIAALLACSGAPSDGGFAELEAALRTVGSPAPDVTLTGMDDATFTLSSLRGKTVLLNFWFYH